MQITPRIHKIGSFVNQYLLIDGETLFLIDTGMTSNANEIIKYIGKLGFKPENLKQILITHADPDHYGAADAIRKLTGATVCASKIEAEAMTKGSTSRPIIPKGFFAFLFPLFRKMLTSPPTFVDQIINDGETLPILEGLQVISAPGHTPGQIVFFLPEEKILFAGDSITIVNKKPDAITDARTGDIELAKNTFSKLMKLDPEIICAGHAYFHLRGK